MIMTVMFDAWLNESGPTPTQLPSLQERIVDQSSDPCMARMRQNAVDNDIDIVNDCVI